MAIADQLLELFYSWIQQRRNCADKLKELARELEMFREECILNSMLMGGASCPIGVHSLSLFNRSFLRAAHTSGGRTASITAQITEHFSSSRRTEEAMKIEQQSNKVAEEIQKLFELLKEEVEDLSSFTDPDELDRCIMNEILMAMARRNGLKRVVNKLDRSGHQSSHHFSDDMTNIRLIRGLTAQEGMALLAGILLFFTFKCNGKQQKTMFAQGTQQLIRKMSVTGFNTALKEGAMVVGGAFGLAFSLPEAIDNWKEQIKNNHVTEASQSLRDTADAILKMTGTLREQLDDIKRMLQEMERMEEEEENNRQAREECESVKRNKIMIVLTNNSQAKGDACQQSNTKQCQCQGQCLCQKQKCKVILKQKRTKKSRTKKPATINLTMQNFCSVNKKDDRTTLGDIVRLEKSDVVAITETWLTELTGDQVLSRHTPRGFDAFHEPRVGGRGGGGVGLVCRQSLRGQRVRFPVEEEITSFESISVSVQHEEWNQPILIITVYRPPQDKTRNKLQAFKKELIKLFNEAKKKYKSIIINGDFNLWIDQEGPEKEVYEEILQETGLDSYVKEPTHIKGHTLDVILGYNVKITVDRVRDNDVSDHFTVTAAVRPSSEESEED